MTVGALRINEWGRTMHMRKRTLMTAVAAALLLAMTVVGCSSGNGSSTAKIQGDVQVAETTLQPSSYEEVTVQKGIPVKWNLKADASVLTNCNQSIIIPSLDIQKDLVAGDNYIEFTPTESGSITYSCWMGMINSKINVVDKL